jgi:hypothetical protein
MRCCICLSLILFNVFFSSCHKAVEYTNTEINEKLAVESYVISGDSLVFVRLEKTTSAYVKSWAMDKERKVKNADVKIFFNNIEYPLAEVNENNILIYENVLYDNWGTYYKKNMIVPAKAQCHLSVKYDNYNLSASSEFPGNTKINNAFIQFFDNGKYLEEKVTLYADFPKNEINYYRIGVLYWYEGSKKEYPIRSHYFYFIINGKNNDNSINCSFDHGFNINIIPSIKKSILYLDHITETYYNFYLAVKEQRNSYDSDLGSEVIDIPTNINGGLGIFTCITRDSICANIME